jgi:hypothetical protein
MNYKYPWQEVFNAITTADSKILADRISDVEALLTSRLQELSHSADSQIEKRALRDSIKELGRIQIERLGYPDWRKSDSSL